jgi:hypothetical protein
MTLDFPTVPERFEAKILALLEAEGEAAFRFVAGIMENYKGEPSTHHASNIPSDHRRRSRE